MPIKGTQTEKNLLIAFAGESQARNRYTYYAGTAKKEGFIQIQAVFIETAEQEKEHAKRLFKLLEGGELSITETFPAGKIGSTSENLAAANTGENHEWQVMYPAFAKTAAEEGFPVIAAVFNAIALAEKQHAKQFAALKARLDDGTTFKRDKPVLWRCRNCGCIIEGTAAPGACPACAHPQSYFEVLLEEHIF
ncbi:MAG: rubrerythrin family protein [Spirochaetaceae bacterium]|jgi:rubrerythrin|nr:rubrerythrin family protein [Spirochaetaceae bacterium]